MLFNEYIKFLKKMSEDELLNPPKRKKRTLEEEVSFLRQENKELQELLDRSNEYVDELEVLGDEKQAKIDSFEETKQHIMEYVEALEAKLDEVEKNLELSDDHCDCIQNLLADDQAQIDGLQDENKLLNMEIEELNKDIETWKHEYKEVAAAMQRYLDESHDLQDKVSDLEAALRFIAVNSSDLSTQAFAKGVLNNEYIVRAPFDYY